MPGRGYAPPKPLPPHLDDESWKLQGACRGQDPELWYPDDLRGTGVKRDRIRDAKRICHRCPVQDQCLQHALARDDKYGIWGGKTGDERRDIQRGRR